MRLLTILATIVILPLVYLKLKAKGEKLFNLPDKITIVVRIQSSDIKKPAGVYLKGQVQEQPIKELFFDFFVTKKVQLVLKNDDKVVGTSAEMNMSSDNRASLIELLQEVNKYNRTLTQYNSLVWFIGKKGKKELRTGNDVVLKLGGTASTLARKR
jgi:hypothetical protein